MTTTSAKIFTWVCPYRQTSLCCYGQSFLFPMPSLPSTCLQHALLHRRVGDREQPVLIIRRSCQRELVCISRECPLLVLHHQRSFPTLLPTPPISRLPCHCQPLDLPHVSRLHQPLVRADVVEVLLSRASPRSDQQEREHYHRSFLLSIHQYDIDLLMPSS